MGVYSGREVYSLGGSHIVVEKGGIFWERGVDSGCEDTSYNHNKGGVDPGREGQNLGAVVICPGV